MRAGRPAERAKARIGLGRAPFGLEDWPEWTSELFDSSDRACAILGGVYLDARLLQLLKGFFVDEAAMVRDLMRRELQPFVTRIKLCYALGFITSSERDDLDRVREIRNDFAHKLHGLSFATPMIATRCAQLIAWREYAVNPRAFSGRQRFEFTVVELAMELGKRSERLHAPRRRRLKVAPDRSQA